MQEYTTAELFAGVRAGDQAAWDALVERFSSLLWGVARGHRLDTATAADVVQTTWLKLVENLDRIREPAALPGWLSTTARRECLRVLRIDDRVQPVDTDDLVTVVAEVDPVDTGLLTDERDQWLWSSFEQLGDRCRQLLRVLMADPPPAYDDVAEALQMPIGSIGPTRGRCLNKLRDILGDEVSRDQPAPLSERET